MVDFDQTAFEVFSDLVEIQSHAFQAVLDITVIDVASPAASALGLISVVEGRLHGGLWKGNRRDVGEVPGQLPLQSPPTAAISPRIIADHMATAPSSASGTR
jgi:hypothetical protein